MGNDENKDIDLHELANITKSTALSLNNMSEMFGGFARKIISMEEHQLDYEEKNNKRSGELENRMKKVEGLVPISADRQMQDELENLMSARVYAVLGTSNRTDDEAYRINNKYFGKFRSKLYRDAKKFGRMGRKAYETKTQDYDYLVGYISNWVPVHNEDGLTGAKAYMLHLDRLEKAREEEKANTTTVKIGDLL